jgi:hypothetical protein
MVQEADQWAMVVGARQQLGWPRGWERPGGLKAVEPALGQCFSFSFLFYFLSFYFFRFQI